MQLNINGTPIDVAPDTPPDMPVLWFLRSRLGLTGTKYACGNDICGACTILADGEAIKSCQMTVAEAEGRAIVTIEGQHDAVAQALFSAWESLDVAQCGFCQPGQINRAAALLRRNPAPSDADIDEGMQGSLCRCATYQRIRKAIHLAAANLAAAPTN